MKNQTSHGRKQAANRVALSGQHLTVEQLIDVARCNAKVALSSGVKERVDASRAALERKLERGELIYGVNTGFGGNVKFGVPLAQIDQHQQNLLRFLSCGTGAPFSVEVTRSAMLLRVNALCNGFSAIRLSVLKALCDLLNEEVTPIVPRYGSVGASGDLVPSSYIARTLLGEGQVWCRGEQQGAGAALKSLGLSKVTLKAKEGLALVNGTCVMTGIAALAVYDAEYLTRMCVAVVAMTVEALHSTTGPFEETIHRLKNHPGQLKVAEMLCDFTRDSSFTVDIESIRERLRGCKHTPGRDNPIGTIELEDSIQPPYSLRCAPQGLGAVLDGLESARVVVEREMNSVNDNPLIDPVSCQVYHTGNFYGGHIARAMDALKLDLCIIANWLNSLLAMLVGPRFNKGLPPNLSVNPSLATGFKGMQLCLTSLTCACRQMAGPSSIHTLPTEQYNQDIVSLGLHSATTALDMVELIQNAVAITLLALCQCLDLRKIQSSKLGTELTMGKMTKCVYDRIREEVGFLESDRAMDGDVARVGNMIHRRSFVSL
jgi:phenylalanine ammonia-lyase